MIFGIKEKSIILNHTNIPVLLVVLWSRVTYCYSALIHIHKKRKEKKSKKCWGQIYDNNWYKKR